MSKNNTSDAITLLIKQASNQLTFGVHANILRNRSTRALIEKLNSS